MRNLERKQVTTMRWLHLSDLHFNPIQDGTDTSYLRDRMINYLQDNNIAVDKLFFTGDLRDARYQLDTDENAKAAADFILEIARTVGINENDNIILVPGNHDLNRSFRNREQLIKDTKANYRTEQGRFEQLDDLVDSFGFYKRVLAIIHGDDYAKQEFNYTLKICPHKYISLDKVNLLVLNTELVAGDFILVESEKSSRSKFYRLRKLFRFKTQDNKPAIKKIENDTSKILIGSSYVQFALSNLKSNGNPIIVLGHRGLEYLEYYEKRKILSLFNDYNVCLYLCGHSHDMWYDEAMKLPQITMGCMKKDDAEIESGFSIGTYDEDKYIISITAFTWENDCWGEHLHFYKSGSTLDIDVTSKVAIEKDFSNFIKIILENKLRQFYCRKDSIDFGVSIGTYISVYKGDLKCTIKNNKHSSLIARGHEFIFSDSKWKVIGVDNTSKEFTSLTCRMELFGPFDDELNEIANINQISSFSIELIVPVSEINIGQSFPLSPMLFDRGRQIEDASFIIKSSDNKIASIIDGKICGNTPGEVTVNISWDDGDDGIASLDFDVLVRTDPQDNISYRLYKMHNQNGPKIYNDFDFHTLRTNIYGIDKYVNGEIMNDEAFEFIVESKKKPNFIKHSSTTDNTIILETKNDVPLDKFKIKIVSKESGIEHLVEVKNVK